MQNKYVGDVGDFGKYGLLRALSGPSADGSSTRLGVVWYLVPDENHTADGGRIHYLRLPKGQAPRFRDCDPLLYDTLRALVAGGKRNVKSVRACGILPAGTVFYQRPLTFAHLDRTSGTNRGRREAWLRGALEATISCDLVFLDPDNGIGASVLPHRKQGVKYAYPDEAHAYLRRGQSVTIYHHLGRRGTAEEQLRRQFERLAAGPSVEMFAMWYRRGTSRAFFVMEPPDHTGALLRRARRMLSGPWSQHFVLVES